MSIEASGSRFQRLIQGRSRLGGVRCTFVWLISLLAVSSGGIKKNPCVEDVAPALLSSERAHSDLACDEYSANQLALGNRSPQDVWEGRSRRKMGGDGRSGSCSDVPGSRTSLFLPRPQVLCHTRLFDMSSVEYRGSTWTVACDPATGYRLPLVS